MDYTDKPCACCDRHGTNTPATCLAPVVEAAEATGDREPACDECAAVADKYLPDTATITALRDEAGRAGDEAGYELAALALRGDDDAVDEVCRMLADARAMDDGDHDAPCQCCRARVTWTDEQEASESGPWCADCGDVLCQSCWDDNGHNCPACMGV